MSLSPCKKLKFFLILAVGLFAQGVVLQLPGILIPDHGSLVEFIGGMGLAAVLMGVVMIGALVPSLVPGFNQRLNLCSH